MRFFTVFILVLLMSGCGVLDERPKTLADLKPVALPAASAEVPKQDNAELIANYQRLLPRLGDDQKKAQLQRRLADLYMEQGEQRWLDQAASGPASFKQAVDGYSELLGRPSQADDQLRYQLARAQDYLGQGGKSVAEMERLVREYPNSDHWEESQFRLGEIYYNRKQYDRATAAYGALVKRGEQGRYYLNALYMTGWSYYKSYQYQRALAVFSQLLDNTVAQPGAYENLTKSQRSLLDDGLRAMSLIFSQSNGASGVERWAENSGEKSYQYLAYRSLATHYQGKRRLLDSAKTHLAFVDRYPQHPLAPELMDQAIANYQQGNFPSLVVPAKQRFVASYGKKSSFWLQHSSQQLDAVLPRLRLHLDELATHFHAKAQKQRKKLRAIADYRQAASYYSELVSSFPEDQKTANYYFLMGQCHYQSGAYPAAVTAFETAAYQQPLSAHSEDAGYWATLSYEKWLDGENRPELLRKKITSELNFVERFPSSKERSAVLLTAAQELLQLDDFAAAAEHANGLLALQPKVPVVLRRQALQVMAQAQYELQDYAGATVSYRQALRLVTQKKERVELKRWLAASLFKQAEVAAKAGDVDLAVMHYLQLQSEFPKEAMAAQGLFDAALLRKQQRQWSGMTQLLEQLRQQHPNHELSSDALVHLSEAYRESKQWGKAADTLLQLRDEKPTLLSGQPVDFIAGEYHQKAGQNRLAIADYERFLKRGLVTVESVEASYQLALLNQKQGRHWSYAHWLNRLVKLEKKLSKKSERTSYLAALASFKQVAPDRIKFEKVRLTAPLARSLKKKQRLLSVAVRGYQQVLSYGVAEFSTLASYELGELYSRLGRDLMASDRPKNLNALELEQYEILLEEQTFPFEEKAIEIHQKNSRRSWSGLYNDGVKNSFLSLEKLMPARYRKPEVGSGYASVL